MNIKRQLESMNKKEKNGQKILHDHILSATAYGVYYVENALIAAISHKIKFNLNFPIIHQNMQIYYVQW